MDINLEPLRGVSRTSVQTASVQKDVDVAAAVGAVNASGVLGERCELRFIPDASVRKMVIQLVDRNTEEVVRQFPPEYVLRVARRISGPDAFR